MKGLRIRTVAAALDRCPPGQYDTRFVPFRFQPPRGAFSMTQFDDVSVVKKANVFFDGKCVSHTVLFKDGSRKSVGVILPGTLTFATGAPEMMEIIAGRCRVRLKGAAEAADRYSP